MALLPPHYLDCVVALGTRDEHGDEKWIATGFLYGDEIERFEDGKSKYRIYLVTNHHVVDGLNKVILRFNPELNEKARTYELSLVDEQGKPLWYSDSLYDSDVVISAINAPKLRDEGIKFSYFKSNDDAANIPRMNELGITEGDSVFVLGFPMGIVGDYRNAVIVRGGAIARVRDMLDGDGVTFLLDAFVFPGNSGGPVILKPELVAVTGTKSQTEAYLVGIISAYVPYQEVAVSQQTGRPRVIFEDNSGLSEVFAVDCIQNAISRHKEYLESSVNSEGSETSPL